MNKLKILLPVLWCAGITPLFSQVLTLDSVLNRIAVNNPMLKMYDAQIDAVNHYAEGAKSWMAPSLSTGLWQTPYKMVSNGMWMITGEQMIPNPVKQKKEYNYMKGMGTVEAEGKNARQNELFAMAKQNFYEWVVLQRKLHVLVQTDSLLSYILQIAQLRYTYNKEKLNNIYKAQADLYELRNMETMLLADMTMKNVELNTLMDIDKSVEFAIDTTLVPKSYEVQITDTSALASARSDIRQFDASLGVVRLRQQFEKSKRLPDFGLSFSHMQSLGNMPSMFAAMGMITIPIAPWSAKGYQSNIKGLDNTASAITYQKQSLINEATGKIASLQTQMSAAKNQIANYNTTIIPSYYKSYQTSLLAYEQNTEDLFVVLDGLKMYRMANLDMLDRLNALLKLQTDYEKEMEIR